MKLKIFPLSTHHILSFKIYQTIRIIFILLQKTSKRQYHLFVCWFKATERKEQHCNLFDKNSLSISRRFSKTLTTLTKGWRLLQTWLLNSLVSWGMLRRRHASWNAYPTGEGKIFPIPTVFFYFPKYNSGNSCCWQYQLETIVCVWNISVSSKKGPIQFEKYPFHLKTCVILYEKNPLLLMKVSWTPNLFFNILHVATWIRREPWLYC